jgi:NAD(P)H-quinone oxidoreductase subunit 5
VSLSWRSFQELLAQDFGIERVYRLSVVLWVRQGSRLTAWFDRYIVDGIVNLVGVASLFSGEGLKYTISGQSRHYLLTVFLGIVVGVAALSWTLLTPVFSLYSSASLP